MREQSWFEQQTLSPWPPKLPAGSYVTFLAICLILLAECSLSGLTKKWVGGAPGPVDREPVSALVKLNSLGKERAAL